MEGSVFGKRFTNFDSCSSIGEEFGDPFRIAKRYAEFDKFVAETSLPNFVVGSLEVEEDEDSALSFLITVLNLLDDVSNLFISATTSAKASLSRVEKILALKNPVKSVVDEPFHKFTDVTEKRDRSVRTKIRGRFAFLQDGDNDSGSPLVGNFFAAPRFVEDVKKGFEAVGA